MGAAEQAATMRDLAEKLDGLANLEAAAVAAKQAYRDTPSADTRAARDQAVDRLRTARAEHRADRARKSGLTPVTGPTPDLVRGKAN